jgi:phospholipase C
LQYQAFAYSNKGYQLAPPKSPYTTLPPALAGGGAGSMGSSVVCVDIDSSFTGTECVTPPNLVIARQFENGLANDYYQYLLTGGTGQPGGQPDKRITYNGQDASNLPSGPYQLTSNTLCGEPGAPLLPDVSAARLLCRRIQRAQWLGLPVRSVSLGGSNGRRRFKRSGSATGYKGEGSTSMGFFNVQQGDAPYLKELADTYSMSDNYHQAVKGGTGANHIMLGTGDAIWFSDGNGNSAVPPNNPVNPNLPERRRMCRPSPTSSQAVSSTAIRRRRNSICSRGSSKRSSTS